MHVHRCDNMLRKYLTTRKCIYLTYYISIPASLPFLNIPVLGKVQNSGLKLIALFRLCGGPKKKVCCGRFETIEKYYMEEIGRIIYVLL